MFTAVRLARRFLMAVLLSAAIGVGPFALPSLASGAVVSLSPPSGPVGTSVQVTGIRFKSCGTVTLTFDGGHPVTGTAAPPAISGTIVVPQGATVGPDHTIAATCDPDPDTGTTYSGSAPFEVTGGGGAGTTTPPTESHARTLTLTPGHGVIGDVIDVQGTGFDVCSPATVDLYILNGPTIKSGLPVTAQGTISYKETIPPKTDPDTYTFRAACANDQSLYADASLVVDATTTTTAHPALTLTPGQGAAATPVTAAGTGFTCPDVQFLWDGAGSAIGTASLGQKPDFSTEITLPTDAKPGAHTVRAVCTADATQYADASFTVTDQNAGTTDNGGNQNGGTTDNGGNQNGGTTDSGGNQNGGGTTDNGGNQNGGGTTDNGGNQNGGTTDNGGTQNGGTTGGGGNGGSATPVGWIVGPASLGGALALAVAAGAYFGRLHRGPRWVRGHVKATLRPVTGSAELTETRAPGEQPTHSTRLDPHPDPGRQTLDGLDGLDEEDR
ncbi:hypothetical protein [Streptomyces sp. NPDC094032]|uniref:hypothetical protein n=1 Tax=Streptomyces sp. NPDC094032 TaxID=3155308 RepID=UPI00331EE780